MQQKQSILEFSANIADGMVTVEEIAGDATNFSNYATYLQGAQAYTESDEVTNVTGQIGDLAQEQGYNSEEAMAAIAELLNTEINEKYAKQYNKKLEAMENQLDMQQKKIETQLTAAQSQLQAVEQAEGQAIQNATPKYTGVG